MKLDINVSSSRDNVQAVIDNLFYCNMPILARILRLIYPYKESICSARRPPEQSAVNFDYVMYAFVLIVNS